MSAENFVESCLDNLTIAETRYEFLKKMDSIYNAKEILSTETAELADEIQQLLNEILEVHSLGQAQIDNVSRLMGLGPPRCKWSDSCTNRMDKFDRTWKHLEDFRERLDNFIETTQNEKAMLDAHKLQTDLEILKNMTFQELKMTMEILNARRRVLTHWKTGLDKLRTEWDHQLQKAVRASIHGFVSLVTTTYCGRKQQSKTKK